jgi:sec-independent protein translocase protein TatA
MPNIGPMEIILLLGLALLLFGAKRLPEIGRSLGSGMREFKDSVTGDRSPEPRSELPPPVPTASAPAAPAAEPDEAPVEAPAPTPAPEETAAAPAPSASSPERENEPSTPASA